MKVQTVIDMRSKKSGTTVGDIAAKLRISKVAAAELIADARAKGVKVKFDVEGGRYYAVAAALRLRSQTFARRQLAKNTNNLGEPTLRLVRAFTIKRSPCTSYGILGLALALGACAAPIYIRRRLGALPCHDRCAAWPLVLAKSCVIN